MENKENTICIVSAMTKNYLKYRPDYKMEILRRFVYHCDPDYTGPHTGP